MNSAAKTARELISFYLDAGVDALVGEEPVDRFADEAKPAPPPAKGRLDSEAVNRQAGRVQTHPSPDRLRRSDPPLAGEGTLRAPAPPPAAPEAAIMAAR